jgi:hypothetical protein
MSQQSTLPLPRWVGLFANEVVGAMQLLGIIMGSWDLLGTGNGVYTYQDIQRYPKISKDIGSPNDINDPNLLLWKMERLESPDV